MLLSLNIYGRGQILKSPRTASLGVFSQPNWTSYLKIIPALKSSRYFLYPQTEHSRTPCSAHSLCLFCMISERTANFTPYTILTDWFYDCGMEYVYRAVGIESLCVFRLLLVFKRAKFLNAFTSCVIQCNLSNEVLQYNVLLTQFLMLCWQSNQLTKCYGPSEP